MAQDELEEINGIKPNIWLADGEEHEVQLPPSKSKYKVKHTFDHFYCTCPAWRNQSGTPVNARTCKHIKSLLGEEYEEARISLKNVNGAPAKSSKPKAKATTSRTKPGSKRKRTDDDEENDNDMGKSSKQTVAAKPKSKRSKVESKLEEAPLADSSDGQTSDQLAEINGIKPQVYLRDGEEREVGSATSRTKYKVKRTMDHYYCTCPAWRNQSRIAVDSRTCKHIKSLLGDTYEEARLQRRTSDSSEAKGDNPASKSKPSSKPPSKIASTTTSKPMSNSKEAINLSAVEEDIEMNDIEGGKKEENGDPKIEEDIKDVEGVDELLEINGVKPKVLMKDGDEREVSSQSNPNSKYKVKRTWDHYYCSCPAWRNQGGAPVNARTCKHLKGLLGEEYENARLFLKNPDGPQPKVKSRGKGKAKATGQGEGDDDGDGKSVPQLLLANKWDLDNGIDPTGWWISEKLDGVRTYFDGKQMISRLGNPFTPPQWFLDKLPNDVTLDGELWGGREEFQSTVSVVKTLNSPHWKTIKFQIFDIPSRGEEPFEARLSYLERLFGAEGSHKDEQIVVVSQTQATDRQHVLDQLKYVESLGGEGLMLRKPESCVLVQVSFDCATNSIESLYEGYRSATLLKIKTFYDAEAIVTGYIDGKGKHAGATGALKCRMASGKTFSVGSGLSDKQRKSPPKIGSIIVYRFQELTKDGVPRFPTFVGIAADKDQPKDAEIPEHRLDGVKADA